MPTKLLDPKLDLVFRMLFGSPENGILLLSLLNAILRPEIPIQHATVLNPEIDREGVEDKGIVLDVRAELADGRQVDVEMQSQPRRARRERGLYYWARMYGTKLSRGDDYGALRATVVILILTFSELDADRFHSTFRVREIHDHEEFSEHFELHVLELPKLYAATVRNEEPELLRWGKFLTASTADDLETLAMTDPVLREAKEALERLSADPKARALAESREIAETLYRVEMNMARTEARDEGLQEGRTQGLQEGRTQGLQEGLQEGRALGLTEGVRGVLMQQLSAKFGELSPTVKQRVATASRSELLRWSARVIEAESVERVLVEETA